MKWFPWQTKIDELALQVIQKEHELERERVAARHKIDSQQAIINQLKREVEELRRESDVRASELIAIQKTRFFDDQQQPAREMELLRAAYKDVLTADQLRNALRGADQTDLFKAVLQVAAGMREQAILQGGGPGESADGRAFTDGEVNALDRLKRDLVARVQAANRD